MFHEGEYVVYGSHGVCRIDEVTTLCMPGSDRNRLYYIMQPNNSKNSKIYSPVDNTKVPLRRIMSEDEAAEMREMLSGIEEADVPNERFREETYKDIMRSCDFKQIAGLAKLLVHRRHERLKQGRKFTTLDERYLRASDEFLSMELSQALGEETDTLIPIWEKK